MAVKYPVVKNGIYYGNIPDNLAEAILTVRQQKVVPGLKYKIFDFPPELIMRSLQEERSIRDIIKSEGIEYTQYIGELKDYQTVGTAFMYLSPRSILGDGVGLGKTVEVAALLNLLKERGELTRFLIAVESSALAQIHYELMRFTGMNIILLPSESERMRNVITSTDWGLVDGVVIKHSALRSDVLSKWLALYLDQKGKSKIFNTFILDESSVVKNVETKIYKYTLNICNIVDRVHFLNATTFETSIMDIYNQVDMLNDTILPKRWRIEREYCKFGRKSYWVKENGKPVMKFARQLEGYKNQQKFKESLKLVYFGRSKKDVGLERPHTYKVYEVEPTNEQSLAMAKGYRYMEVLNCPSLIPEAKVPFDVEHVPKLKRIIQLVENEFYDNKIMIYCYYIDAQRKIADELMKIGKTPVIINGEDSDDERWEKMKEFNKGSADVLITNVKKSLNLYGGDVCIFYTVETNPAKMEQIRGRIDRNVDDSIKTYVILVYRGTDEYKFLTKVVRQRAQDARSLTIDAKTAVDYFMEAMEQEGKA